MRKQPIPPPRDALKPAPPPAPPSKRLPSLAGLLPLLDGLEARIRRLEALEQRVDDLELGSLVRDRRLAERQAAPVENDDDEPPPGAPVVCVVCRSTWRGAAGGHCPDCGGVLIAAPGMVP